MLKDSTLPDKDLEFILEFVENPEMGDEMEVNVSQSSVLPMLGELQDWNEGSLAPPPQILTPPITPSWTNHSYLAP